MTLNNSINAPNPMVYIRSPLLDLTSASSQVLFTLPKGRNFIAIASVNQTVTLVNYTVDGSLQFGTNSPTFDNWQSGGAWFVTTNDSSYPNGFLNSNPIAVVHGGDTVTALFGTPLTADSATGYVYILGVYI